MPCTFNIEKYGRREYTLHLPSGRTGLSLIFLMKRFSPSTELLVDAEAPGKSGAALWFVILDILFAVLRGAETLDELALLIFGE